MDDIYAVVERGAKPDRALVLGFANELAGLVANRLESAAEPRVPTLRMSNLGRPDRQLWYQFHAGEGAEAEELPAHTRLKFLIGDIWEAVILFLAEVAGHRVEQKQATVEVDGIVGHIDAVIDDVVVDVKSASTHAFKKFKEGRLAEDDPFGYIEQISGYGTALGKSGAFLAGDKQNGHITLLQVPKEDIDALNIKARIEHLKEVVASEDIPDRCYDPQPHGQSGNLALSVGCSYCPFKHRCWSDANGGLGLRTFLYSGGPVHFVHVEREPKTVELTF